MQPVEWGGSGRSRTLAWSLCGLAVLGPFVLLLLGLRHHDPEAAENILGAVPLIVLPTGLGTLLALRQPANPIGWLLTSGALVWLIGGLAADLAKRSLEDGAALSVWAGLAQNLDDKFWPAGVICSVGLPLLLFPTGRTRSRRGNWVLRAMVAGGVLAVLGGAVSTDPLRNPVNPSAPLANPWGIASIARITGALAQLGNVLVVLATVAVVGGVVKQFRSVTGTERQQLRWVGYGALLASMGMLVFFFDHWLSHRVMTLVFTFGFGALPVTFTVAILRYRLYDLDRIVSRTVTYASVTGLLVATYVGLVTAVSRLTPSGNSLAVAASTLSVAALFQPLRRRVQQWVDRHFNRARVDAQLTVEAFSRKLREQVDLEAVRADLLAVAHQTMQPTSAALWLRGSATP